MSNFVTGKGIRYFFLLLTAVFFAQNVKSQTPTASPQPTATPLVQKTDDKKSDKKEDKKADDKDKKPDDKKDDKKADVAVKPTPKGRLPVIIIPGLIGSELVNKVTDEKVWFSLRRAKDDDLRLPISPDLKSNKDNLVATDILRKVKLPVVPDIEIYKKLAESLETDGYTEASWDAPPATGYADTFYVFPYDWRLDNVENAQLLLKRLDDLRVKLNKPNLKFNLVAHSMGGLIARYAAMYGKDPLPIANPQPVWRGAPYINSISLIATPNSGATSALNSLLKGFSLFGGGKLNLPFIQKITKYDIFTIPSVYELLPHDGAVRAFDENLRPMKIDIYDPATWEKYGWAAYMDEDFKKNFEPAEQATAKEYFRNVLLQAKRFAAALDAKPATRNPIPTYYLGSECKETLDGFIVRPDDKKGWITEFGAPSFTRSNGVKVTSKETKALLNTPGDGVVPKTSLIYSYVKLGRLQNRRSGVLINDISLSCDEHNRLTGNAAVDKNLFSILSSSLPETNPPTLVKPENRGSVPVTTTRRTPTRRTPVKKYSRRRN